MSVPLLPEVVAEIGANAVKSGHMWSLTARLRNTENYANLLLPLGIQKPKDFQLQGEGLRSLPLYLIGGFAP